MAPKMKPREIHSTFRGEINAFGRRLHLLDLQGAAVLYGAGVFDAILGPRFGPQPRKSDSVARRQAVTVRPVFDPDQGFVDLLNQRPLAGDQTERKILLPIVAAQVGHVNGHRRVLMFSLTVPVEGLIRQLLHITGQLSSLGDQQFLELQKVFGRQARLGQRPTRIRECGIP